MAADDGQRPPPELLLPGSVAEVRASPPLSVKHWTVEDLSERIAEVRQLYLDTLEAWPGDTLPDATLYAESTQAQATSRADTKRRSDSGKGL